ncbi:hypothetical protein D3C71_1650220 [compost metagenome]
MAVTETWIDAQPHRMPGRDLPQLFQHVDRTDVDRDFQFADARQSRVIEHIGGKHDFAWFATRLKTGLQCTFNLA